MLFQFVIGTLVLFVGGAKEILMIIKGLFRRYKRWNPVHPTLGAFWGMGIGIGCGVGWGPGFGPEVIGYVGAGCGVGFSVGITFAGFGIGLPANFVFEVPYNAFLATRSTLQCGRDSGLFSKRDFAGDDLKNIGSHISGFQREANARFLCFKHKLSLDKGVSLPDMKSIMSFHTRSLGAFSSPFVNPFKGVKD